MKKSIQFSLIFLTSLFSPELSGKNDIVSAETDFENEKTVLLNPEEGLKKNVVYGTIGTAQPIRVDAGVELADGLVI